VLAPPLLHLQQDFGVSLLKCFFDVARKCFARDSLSFLPPSFFFFFEESTFSSSSLTIFFLDPPPFFMDVLFFFPDRLRHARLFRWPRRPLLQAKGRAFPSPSLKLFPRLRVVLVQGLSLDFEDLT